MVYKKGLTSRYSRSGWPGSSAAGKASKALYMVSKIARSLNVEKKYYDREVEASVTGATIIRRLVNGVGGQGASAGGPGTERDGEQVRMTSLQYQISLTNDDQFRQRCRVVVVMDKQADGTEPTMAEMFQYSSTLQEVVDSPYNMDNKYRFTFLHDRRYVFAEKFDTGSIKNISWYKKLGIYNKRTKSRGRGIPIRFNADAPATPANISTNPIYLFIIPAEDPVAGFTTTGFTRLRFVDN